MTAPRPRSADAAGPVGRSAAVEALTKAVADVPRRPAWVVLEGPAGSGRTTMLDLAAALGGQRGLVVGRLTGDDDGDPIADAPVRRILEQRAGPAVLCVDELQWLGAPTLARLDALRTTSPDTAVVAAVRTGAPARAPGRLDDLRAAASAVVALPPLDAKDVRRMLGDAGVSTDPALAGACVELCAGNARLLALVADRLAAVDGAATIDGLAAAVAPLLPRVARLCTSEIERSGAAAHGLLGAALVLGDATPLWLVAELAGVERGDAARIADALTGCGLLATADPVRVAAPLVGRALAAEMTPARRDELHRRAAALLGRTDGGVEAAADHLVVAAPCGEAWPAAILREAADAATARGEHDRAIAWLERALQEPLPAPLRATLLVELGSVRDRGGRPGAEDAYRRALRIAELPDRARVHLLLGRSRFGAGDYGGAAAELDRGLAALDDADDPLAVELIAAYVAAARFDGTLQGEAQRRLAPVLDRSAPGRTAAERALLAEVALERGIAGAPRDDVVALAHRAWAGGRLLDGGDAHGIALSQVAAALTWSDAFADSERVLSAAVERAERDGVAHVAATARYLRAWPRYYRGALAEAEADVRAALDGAVWEMYEPSARAVLAHVLLDTGDHDGAREALALADAEPWRQTPPYGMLLEARARLHVLDGDLAAAGADLAAAGAVLEAMGSRHPFCPWRSRLGLVVARQGDPAAGRGLVEAELAQARTIGVPRATGVALRARGLLEAAAGGAAEADLRAAVDELEGCGARLEQARTLVDLGRCLTQARRRAEARTSLREAVDLAEAAGAAAVADRARRELGRSGGRALRSAPGAPGGLTPSELVVARLAADGRTNREIAAELVVTPHTVRFHLGNVYRKLGVSARDELQATLARRS